MKKFSVSEHLLFGMVIAMLVGCATQDDSAPKSTETRARAQADVPVPRVTAAALNPAMQAVEDAAVDQVTAQGTANRFVVARISPETENGVVCSFTISAAPGPNPKAWLLQSSYPKDRIPMRLSGELAGAVVTGRGDAWVPAGDISLLNSGSVIRFAGTVSLKGYSFQGDAQNPLAFLLLRGAGLVHLAGKGQVTSPEGQVTDLPQPED